MIYSYLIQIYPIKIEEQILRDLVQQLKKVYNAKITVDISYLKWDDIVKFYNPSRRQVNADNLIYWLSRNIKLSSNSRILVLANIDGYVEGLNFVFGLSKLGFGGIVFTLRLNPIFYGQEYDEKLYRLRIFKETLHELGHSYGLSHCLNFCVMRFSNSIYDVDKKPSYYCQSCQRKIEHYNPGLLKL